MVHANCICHKCLAGKAIGSPQSRGAELREGHRVVGNMEKMEGADDVGEETMHIEGLDEEQEQHREIADSKPLEDAEADHGDNDHLAVVHEVRPDSPSSVYEDAEEEEDVGKAATDPDTVEEEKTITTEAEADSSRTEANEAADEGTNEAANIADSPLSQTPISPEVPIATPVAPVSPITPIGEVDAQRSNVRDSMASIALSDTSLDYDHLSTDQIKDVLATPKVRGQSKHVRRPSSIEILGNAWPERPALERHSTLFDMSQDQPPETPMVAEGSSPWQTEHSHAKSASVVTFDEADSNGEMLKTGDERRWGHRTSSLIMPRPRSDSSSEDQIELDWSQLDRNEEQEKEDKDLPEGAEDASTSFLLARLEQENAKIDAFSKAAVTKSVSRVRSESRPASMGHLKKLLQDRNAPSIRYSMAPDMKMPESPPPMTELEFWAALVQDYPSTASRLPTLTTTKIRAGIPPPLRGVVWASMSGARSRSLEDAFERLQNEKSPYEGIINKDVGRSFPGVELFRDAEGEGQRMLGRVLNCFSLHDKDIGYCQGLGFLVGPLLMNMGECEAFCVLVKLMDAYNLRPSFLPSLSGLHMRIYQFSALLKQHLPALAEHLENMGVEPAYLSQWFLSCFAVTCPLPMLFRIYDVIFAEGANETVMRVALALMRRNESKMVEATEFEEVMGLLLGRGIWDCYGFDADELVDDFTSLGDIITHSRLAELEKEFDQQSSDNIGQSAGFLPDVQGAASRFLGRLWAPNHAAAKSTSTLSPQTAEKDVRTGSLLRRSPSKQSISTLNESNSSDGSSGSASTTVTEPDAEPSRESQQTSDAMSFKSKPESLRTVSIATGHGVGLSKEERDMHGQIEDLLTALSELQREHQQLAAMLQVEREDRAEDQRGVSQLVSRLQKTEEHESAADVHAKADRRKTLPARPKTPAEDGEGRQRPRSLLPPAKPDPHEDSLDGLVRRVNDRLKAKNRFSASFETKAQLRSNLARTRERLVTAETQSKDLASRLEVAETSLAAFTTESEDLRAEVRELRVRVNEEFKARQKLEHNVRELKAEARCIERKDRERLARTESMSEAMPTLSRRDTTPDVTAAQKARRESIAITPGAAVGLRELRLGRRDSTSSVQSLRTLRIPAAASQRGERTPDIHVQTQLTPTSATIPAPSPDDTVTTASVSPPADAAVPETPIKIPGSVAPPGPFTPLGAPAATFAPRGSSLATQQVLATPAHEVVGDDALLLELVNAKTAEAQANQEVDELKRSLNLSNRRHDAALAKLQAELDTAKAEAVKARGDARDEVRKMYQAVDAARQEAAAGLMAGFQGLNVPSTPAPIEGDSKMLGNSSGTTTPVETPVSGKKGSAEGSGSGWFWSRRTASTTKASLTPPNE